MREDQFIKLSQAGENAQIEYKTCYEQISDSLYETVCSFLNHSGGHILVGVKDNGEIVGVNPDKATTLQGNIITAIKNPDLFLPCPYFTPQILTNVSQNLEMSAKNGENVSQNLEMSVKNEDQFEAEELTLSIDDTPGGKKNLQKKQKRHQGIIRLIRHNPQITTEEMAEKLEVKVRTIYRDLEELKHLIEYVGPSKGGYWKLLK